MSDYIRTKDGGVVSREWAESRGLLAELAPEEERRIEQLRYDAKMRRLRLVALRKINRRR